MAKDDPAASEAAAPPLSEEAVARRRAEEQKFWEAARGRKKKSRRGVVIGVGVVLGAAIAGGATIYGPQLLTSPPPAQAAPLVQAAAPAETAPQGPPKISGVGKAADGATLTVAGRTVKLQGIQAPPSGLVCRDTRTEYRCGEVARKALESFAGSAPVTCTPASGARDIAVCRNQRGFDIASLQVESGWAIVAARSSEYAAEQAIAQKKEAGLWRGAFARPELWIQAAAVR